MRGYRRLNWLMAAAVSGLFACQGTAGEGNRPGTKKPGGIGTSMTPGTAIPDFTVQNPGTGMNTAPPAGNQFADEPVVMRRLTRVEYDNSVRDLTSANLGLAYTFPAEEVVRGFTNNAWALTFPPMLGEKAYTASQQVAKHVSANINTFVPCAATASQACAQQFMRDFGQRVVRRPLTNEEVTGLTAVFDVGNRRSFARGIELVVSSLFISAPFWYRVEAGDGQEVAGKPGLVRPTSFEMASRLSYLAWNSTPDPALLSLAEQDSLKSPEQVQAAFDRLLSDPRSRETVANFHDQWLQLSRTESINKDPEAFPQWKIEMRSLLSKELDLFVERAAWDSPRGFEDLMTSNASFANAELATFYGVTGPAGSDFGAVTLDASTRSGFLTRAGFLALEGFVQTSPVRRAAFIRRQLLCQDPPAPPPNVDNTPIPPAASNTTRDRTIAHTTNAACAGCHQLLDPLGFGLEHYDAIGQYRQTENGFPIDDNGAVIQSDIGTFKGAQELGQKFSVSAQAQQCFAQQWYRFAYGRSPAETRFESVQKLTTGVQATGGNYREVLRQLVTLDEFLYHPKTAI